ncbi:hypothetical protein [Paucibacter sp. Y2R2-4]|uniref:hypothetical protein n=1 Tax=Paucibacter sp. Y2R2-4 TaxID=2893553 RepID=UPI0021E4784A|nr:hypothetical protein [Paucibacter sp. Y2R2-4]MCV2349190.1 hypothetical protein [Paucibacter sp. Y2R2-4]
MSLPLGLVCSLVLSACGGGGGGSGGTDAGSGTTGTAIVFTNSPTLSGVAAVAAPLTGAQIKVIDGTGTSVGSATTLASDGSYSLTLSSKSLTAPLFVQVRGVDAAGAPQVLHSAVPVMSAASAAMVANVTPLSDAIVALSMGGDPKPVFSAADQNKAVIAQVATAASAAGEFVKTLVKTQLTDLKITDPKTLDLLGDPAFVANKGAQDLLLESLRVDLAKSSKGVAQLQLSNKLMVGTAAEVVVELPQAQTELLKTADGLPANAISSVLKVATSPTATLANMGSLDELSAALNQLMLQTLSATTIAAHPLLATYGQHNGRQKADLAALLASYASRGLQVGRVQATGCADDSVTAGLCLKVLFSALVTDNKGSAVAVLSDAISYNKSSTTGSKWNLVGNGKKLDLAVYPMAFLALEGSGALSISQVPNPSLGLQFEIQAQKPAVGDALPTKLMDSATVQTPGGFGLGFAYCRRALLCLSKTPGATLQDPTGDITDTAVQKANVAWIGPADGQRGGKYTVAYSIAGASETRPVYLRADVLSDVAQSRFPVLDGVSADKPIRFESLKTDLTLNWSAWAAANPDLRLINVRTVVNGGVVPWIVDTAPAVASKTSMVLTALALPGNFTPIRSEIWLYAQDAGGRRFYTRYTMVL